MDRNWKLELLIEALAYILVIGSLTAYSACTNTAHAAAADPPATSKVSAAAKDALSRAVGTDLRQLAETADVALKAATALATAFQAADDKLRKTARTAPGYDAALQARFDAKVPYEAAAIRYETARKAFEDAKATAQAADAALDAELCGVVKRTPEIDAFCARRTSAPAGTSTLPVPAKKP
jgi:hypothetical protein